MSIPPAWHPDPTGRHDHRWWDGTQWTEHVADAGVAAVDPVEGAAPSGGTEATTGGGPTGGGPDTTGGGAATVGPGETSGGAGAGAAWTSPQGEQAPPAGAGDPTAPGAAGAWGAQPASGGYAPGAEGGAGPAPAGTDGLAIAALVIGLASLASVVVIIGAVFIFGAIGGVVSVVLGSVALSRVKKSQQRGRGMAITGLVTGILAVVGTIVAWVAILTFPQLMGGFMGDYQECLDETGGDTDQCEQELEEELERRFFGGN